jgi:K+-sensing histidine kinase KdpD
LPCERKEFLAAPDNDLGRRFAPVNEANDEHLPMNRTMSAEAEHSTTQTTPELGLTMTRILKNPLAALRASMESLARELPASDPRSEHVRAALDEVVRISRGVQDLVDFTAPREIKPLSCTAEELLYSTVHMLPEPLRRRVRVARAEGMRELSVDGPQLCQAMRHLVEYALATAADEVLFGVREEADAIIFTLVSESTDATKRESTQLDLWLHLAGRDIPRMGGSLKLQHSARGATCIQIVFEGAQRGGRTA